MQARDRASNQAVSLGEMALRLDRTIDYGSKQWCENQLIVAIKSAMHGRPAIAVGLNPQPRIERNPALAITGVMALAKLKGYIVERRSSMKASIDLAKMSPAELRTFLNTAMTELDPTTRREIEAVAAGEAGLIEADSEASEAA